MSAADLATSVRVALVAPLVWALSTGEARWAVGIFTVAAASDALDGWLARRFHVESEAGRWFDNAADIMILTAAYSTLAAVGRVPVIVPIAICASFAFYVADSLWVSRGVSLVASRIGHFAGISNYAILVALLVDDAVPEISLAAWLRSLAFAAIPIYSVASVAGRMMAWHRPDP